jgi:hypothetical protein
MANDKLDDVKGRASEDDAIRAERRAFLAKAGRFAAATPPAILMMLSVTDKAKAQARSNQGQPA